MIHFPRFNIKFNPEQCLIILLKELLVNRLDHEVHH